MLVNVSEGDKVDSLLTLKQKTDVSGRPCMNKWCPDSESFLACNCIDYNGFYRIS